MNGRSVDHCSHWDVQATCATLKLPVAWVGKYRIFNGANMHFSHFSENFEVDRVAINERAIDVEEKSTGAFK